MIQILAINGTVLKTPAKVKWSLSDISSPNSGRTLDGIMHKQRVAQKVKLTCSWPAMPFEEASFLINAVDAETFSLTYFDLKQNSERTAPFYVGDRSSDYKWILNDSQVVENVSFDFIEV